MSKISKTGFWTAENASSHHVHSQPLSDWIISYLSDDKDTPVYDFGCGMGFYSSNLRKAGFKVTGYEGDPPRDRLLSDCVKQDLTKPFLVPSPGNVLFLEVIEHIPAIYEQNALNNVLAACKDKLILSWAVRGQAGFGHVNCLDNHEAIAKIEEHGFAYLEEPSLAARALDLDNAPWFRNTMLIFKKV